MRSTNENAAALAGARGAGSSTGDQTSNAKSSTAKPYRVTVRGTRMRIWGRFADGAKAGATCERLRRLGFDAVVEREAK